MRISYASGAFSPSDNVYWATWSLLTACNYTCSYCPIRANEIVDDNNIKNTISLFKNISETKKLEVTLFGGEPTLHPKYKCICERLSEFCNIRVFTNFTDDVNTYNDMYNRYGTTYAISYHPDMINAEQFLKNVDMLESKRCIGHINIMMVPEYDIDVEHVSEYCRKNIIPHRMAPICELGNMSAYIKSIAYSKRDDVIPVMDTFVADNRNAGWMSNEECEVYNQNEFLGYRCWKWKTSCFVDHRGNVYGCLQDMKCDNFVKVTDFDISKHEIEKSCPYPNCICETYIPKEITEGYADIFLKGIIR